jgi:3-methylcrotonyl-CoA carboxylase alpha subunit
LRAAVDGRGVDLTVLERSAGSIAAEIDGRIEARRVFEEGRELHLYGAGRHVVLSATATDDTLQAGEGGEEGSLLTPLPGTIVAVHVSKGDKVERGAPLVTVEAMKMEHTLTAPYAGVVEKVAFSLKERVAAGAVLVELTPA